MLGMTTNDPNLKCGIDGCQLIGMGTCHWDNCCLRDKKKGGCGKRVCEQHRYHSPNIIVV